jgi:hypothetical protein
VLSLNYTHQLHLNFLVLKYLTHLGYNLTRPNFHRLQNRL